MATITISLPDDQFERLRQHALASNRSLDDVVRDSIEGYLAPDPGMSRAVAIRETIDAYLAQLPEIATPRVIEPTPGPPTAEWQARFDAALARIRAQVPPDMTPEEIEALIAEASEEARHERIVRRIEQDRAGAVETVPGAPESSQKAEIAVSPTQGHTKVPTEVSQAEIDAESNSAREEARPEQVAKRRLND